MPISSAWDPQRRIWTFTAGESFTLDDVGELLEKVELDGGALFLWDLRELLSGPDSPDEIREAAELGKPDQERWAGSRVAIVVARDLDFGIARMFHTYSRNAGVEYAIFRDPETALDWLVVPSDP